MPEVVNLNVTEQVKVTSLYAITVVEIRCYRRMPEGSLDLLTFKDEKGTKS
jgi:hypothetical protein